MHMVSLAFPVGSLENVQGRDGNYTLTTGVRCSPSHLEVVKGFVFLYKNDSGSFLLF